MATQYLPGVRAQRPPREPVTARERIARLRAAGLRTEWYDRHPRNEPLETVMISSACSIYRLHVMEGQALYTAHYATGEAYGLVRNLERPVEVRAWVCLVCTRKWRTWNEAKQHCKQDT